MGWAEVERILHSEMIPLMRNRRRGKRWIKALADCEDGKLLGTCIAIDIVSESIAPQIFADIVDRIKSDLLSRVGRRLGSLAGQISNLLSGSPSGLKQTSSKVDARKAFGNLVNRRPECLNYVCKSKFRPNPHDADGRYARVLELGDFIEYYVRRGYTSSPTNVQRVKSMYFDKGGGVSLGDIEGWWECRLPSVWVTQFDDLEDLLRGIPSSFRGSIVCDAMGLNIYEGCAPDGRPDIVAVVYPEPFSVGCRQPSTLDAWWIDSGRFYVSYLKADNWGRTHSVSGNSLPQRERVHSLFKDLTRDFRTYYVGVATPPIENRDALLAAAYDRLVEGMKTRTP